MKAFFSFCLLLLFCTKGSTQRPPPQYLTGGEMYYTYQGMQNGEHLYRVTIQCYAPCDNAGHPELVSVSIFDRLTHALVKKVIAPQNGVSTESMRGDLRNNCSVNPPGLCHIAASYSFEVSLPPSVWWTTTEYRCIYLGCQSN